MPIRPDIAFLMDDGLLSTIVEKALELNSERGKALMEWVTAFTAENPQYQEPGIPEIIAITAQDAMFALNLDMWRRNILPLCAQMFGEEKAQDVAYALFTRMEMLRILEIGSGLIPAYPAPERKDAPATLDELKAVYDQHFKDSDKPTDDEKDLYGG